MVYGYNIEVVSNGFILTVCEPNYGGSMAPGLPKQTRHVFESLDELLEFLKGRLK